MIVLDPLQLMSSRAVYPATEPEIEFEPVAWRHCKLVKFVIDPVQVFCPIRPRHPNAGFRLDTSPVTVLLPRRSIHVAWLSAVIGPEIVLLP